MLIYLLRLSTYIVLIFYQTNKKDDVSRYVKTKTGEKVKKYVHGKLFCKTYDIIFLLFAKLKH